MYPMRLTLFTFLSLIISASIAHAQDNVDLAPVMFYDQPLMLDDQNAPIADKASEPSKSNEPSAETIQWIEPAAGEEETESPNSETNSKKKTIKTLIINPAKTPTKTP